MKSPQISVVIPSKDQWPRLRLVLYGLTSQEEAPEFEVVIVDDGSSDAIEGRIAKEPGQFASLNLRIVRHEVNKGRCAARNTGVEAARGRYCLFLDGDAVPDRMYVRGHLEELEKEDHRYTLGNIWCLKHTELFHDPETGDLNPDLEIPRPFIQTLRENYRSFLVGRADILDRMDRIRDMAEPGVIPMTAQAIERFGTSVALQDTTQTHPLLWARLVPHNFGARREDYLAAGGLNPDAVFFEGVELSYRLLRLGCKPVVAERATSFHLYHYHDLGSYEADELRARGLWQFLKRQPERGAAVGTLFIQSTPALPSEFFCSSLGEALDLAQRAPRAITADILRLLEHQAQKKPPRLAVPRSITLPPRPAPPGPAPTPASLPPHPEPPAIRHQDPEFSSLSAEDWKRRAQEVAALQKNHTVFRLKVTAVISMEAASEAEWHAIHLPFPIVAGAQRLLGPVKTEPADLAEQLFPRLGAFIDYRFRRQWGEMERRIGYEVKLFVRGHGPFGLTSLRGRPSYNLEDPFIFGPVLRTSARYAEVIHALLHQITDAAADPLENLRRIRDWVLAHRPFSPVARCACENCALGNLQEDISGPEKLAAVTFIHLARGCKIPARLAHGILPMGAIGPLHSWRFSIQQTGFPGCWPEIFSWDKGWLPVDLTPLPFRPKKQDPEIFGGLDALRVRLGEPDRRVRPVSSQQMMIATRGQSAQLDLRPRIDVELERMA